MEIYYFKFVFSIFLIIIFIFTAFAIDFIYRCLQKIIKQKYLNITIIFLLVLLMSTVSYFVSILGDWSYIDTAFILSLCFFGIGWMTKITNKASINSAGTFAKFISNNSYTHEYEAASTSLGRSLYFISSLIFLIGSWIISFILAFYTN